MDWAAQKVKLMMVGGVVSLRVGSGELFNPCLQLSSVTSSLTEQIMSHLFSQVRLIPETHTLTLGLVHKQPARMNVSLMHF